MAVSNQDIINFLLSNPGMSDADIASAMATYGVSPSQMASAVGLPVEEVTARVAATIPTNQATLFGDTYVQPIYSQTGSGMDAQQGPIENIVTYKADDNKTGGDINWISPTGTALGTTKQQEVSNSLTPFILGSAALFGGLGGGFEGLFGGGGANAASLAADADIAGGLIPEFGTNAAYNSFMTGAMTPEALAALDALVAANPEIIGSGALLTDAAAGLTPAVTPTTPIVTPTATTPAVTPTTPVTPTVPPVVPPVTPTVTPTVTPAVTSLLPTLTPSVISALTGLLGSTVLNKALTPSTTTPAKVSIPTQGVPLNSEDYFKAIQQNYNSLMPAVPRDVASPLAAWYNSQYGA